MVKYLVHPEVAKVMLVSGTPLKDVQEGNEQADKAWERRCEEIAAENLSTGAAPVIPQEPSQEEEIVAKMQTEAIEDLNEEAEVVQQEQ